MKKTILTCALTGVVLAGCGGGGDGGDAPSTSNSQPAYITSGGLQWSAPSDGLYINPSLAYSLNTSETTAQAYCTQQTCDSNNQNCSPSNFNHQAGWRLPTLPELQAFYASGALPAAWNRSETWTTNSGIALNLNDGQATITLSDTTKYRVSCVKPG